MSLISFMEAKNAKPWKGVIFNCCGVYGRIYFQVQRKLWTGHCPKCLKSVAMKNPELGQ